MDAATLNCPTCGAAVSSDATQCEYCGAKLATVACPSCFGLAFFGSKFCPHCGAELAQSGDSATSILSCPRCKVEMQQKTLSGIYLVECARCGGLWIDKASFEKICADREEQAAVLGQAQAPPHVTIDPNPRYLPCPRCGELMNRLNFAHRSGVIIDICNTHGIWFDADELRRIIEFIRSGGMDRAREAEKQQLEEARRQLEASQRAARIDGSSFTSPGYDPDTPLAIGLVADFMRGVLR